MKNLLPLSLSILILGSIGCTSKPNPDQKPSAGDRVKAYVDHCVPGPSEQCATPEWYTDYLKWKDLGEPYKPPQEIADRLSGMGARLMQRRPPNTLTWDETKEVWVLLPTPPAVVPTPAPATGRK